MISLNKEQELQECKREINELQHRINVLADKVGRLSAESEKTVVENIQTPTWEISQQPLSVSQKRNNEQKTPQRPPIQKIKTQQKPKVERIRSTNQNMEGNIGKNLFAIIASILILIGVGIFISTIYEYIPEFVKIIAIYLFGFVMVGLGIGVYFKNKNNFWLGLASCGTAELLVSIIASYTYFKVISLPITFAFIIAWVIGTFVLTKVKPTLFKIIGYIGFLSSIILGLDLLHATDGKMFIALFISYIAVNTFFILSHKNLQKLNLSILYIGMLALGLFSSTFYYIPELQDVYHFTELSPLPNYIELHCWMALYIAVLNVIHLFKYKEYNGSYAIYSGLSLIFTVIYLSDFETEILYMISTAIVTGLWVLNTIKCGANNKGLLFDFIATPTFLLITLLSMFSDNTTFLLVVIIPIVTLTLLYTKMHDYASGFMGLLCFAFLFAADLPELLMCTICLIFAISLFALTRNEQKWGLIVKNGWYSWTLCCIMILLDTLSSNLTYNATSYEAVNLISDSMLVATFVIIAIINTVRIVQSAYTKSIGFNHNAESIFLYIVNGLLICNGLNILGPNDMELLPTLVMIFVMFILLSVTLWQPLNTEWKRQYLTLIHCVKFTFYFWFLMMTFEAEMIFINIAMLICAITAIVIGFKIRSKPARIYGLILSLISSISLVLFSVSFDSTLQVAGGIIVCGLLCFVISFIYSKASKALDTSDK